VPSLDAIGIVSTDLAASIRFYGLLGVAFPAPEGDHVEATLLKQSYQLAQSRYELAQLKYERKATSAGEVARARSAYQAATVALQKFWDTKRPSD